MRKLIKFTCGNIMALITSIALLTYFNFQLKDSPGAIILIVVVVLAWMLYIVLSIARLLDVR